MRISSRRSGPWWQPQSDQRFELPLLPRRETVEQFAVEQLVLVAVLLCRQRRRRLRVVCGRARARCAVLLVEVQLDRTRQVASRHPQQRLGLVSRQARDCAELLDDGRVRHVFSRGFRETRSRRAESAELRPERDARAALCHLAAAHGVGASRASSALLLCVAWAKHLHGPSLFLCFCVGSLASARVRFSSAPYSAVIGGVRSALIGACGRLSACLPAASIAHKRAELMASTDELATHWARKRARRKKRPRFAPQHAQVAMRVSHRATLFSVPAVQASP